MWKEESITAQDLQALRDCPWVPWQELRDKTVLITGATGLIGRLLVKALAALDTEDGLNIRILAAVRNEEKAKRLFAPLLDSGVPLSFTLGDIREPLTVDGPVDAIIHAASVTSSQMFVQQPVETIQTVLTGLTNVLELAREKQSQWVVFLSTMEIYGTPQDDRPITETDYDYLDPVQVRSSYPESKRMAECLCAAYASEYGVPVKIARLTQTFGPGVQYDDGRVFAEFARCALEGRDIVLHTQGLTKRSYLYTADAVSAIFTILLRGENGQAYHAANQDTYCSIAEMAQLVAQQCAEKPVAVCIRAEDGAKFGYAPTLHMNLDTAKLRGLGWKPTVGLADMYRRMMAAFEEG